MPEQLEHPEGVARPPVVLVAVEHDRRVGRDAEARHQPLEAFFRDVVAADLIVEIGGPVHVHRARDVAGRVEERVLVGFDQPDVAIVEVLLDPVGRHQRIGVLVTALLDGSGHVVLLARFVILA